MQTIIMKHGKAKISDDYEIIGDAEEYKEAEGAVVIEFRNGAAYDLPHAVFPTKEYKIVSDAEEILAYHAILERHHEIANLMKTAKSPKEIIAAYKNGAPIEDNSIWPGLFPVYRNTDKDYQYLIKNHMIHGAVIIDD